MIHAKHRTHSDNEWIALLITYLHCVSKKRLNFKTV